MLRRTRHHLGRACAALFVGLIAVLIFGAWRLTQGPVSLAILVPAVQKALARPDLGLDIRIAGARLSWTDFTEDPEIVALDVHARGPDGRELLAVPQLRLTLSGAALMEGRLAPARIEVSRLKVSLIRRSDGTVDFGLQPLAPTPTAAPEAPEAGLSGISVSELLAPPVRGRPGGYLRAAVFENATVEVRDERRGTLWQASPAEVRVTRDKSGVRLAAALAVQYGDRGGTAWLEAHRQPDGRTTFTADLGAARLDLLGPFLPDPALATMIDAPLNGRLSAVLENDDRLTGVSLDLQAGAGALKLPGKPALAVEGGSLRGRWDLAAERVEIGRFAVTVGGREMSLEGTVAPRMDAAALDLRFAGLRLDVLRPLLPPDAARAEALALPLSGQVKGTVGFDGRPRDGRLNLTLGAGRILLPGIMEGPLDLRSGNLAVTASQGGAHIALERASIDLAGTVLTAKATAAFDGGDLAIDAETELRNLSVAALRRFWPLHAVADGRKWVVGQIREGNVGRMTAKGRVVLRGPGFGEVVSQAVAGSFDFAGVQARYWDPMPPLREVKGVATFTDKRLELKVESGRDGKLQVDDSTVLLSGFDKGSGTADIEAGLKGPLVDLMTLLDRAPLGYARKLGVQPAELAGDVQGRLKIRLPLLANVLMDQVELNARATVEGARLPRAALGRDLTQAKVEADVDKKRIVAKGAGRFGGAPVQFQVTQAFDLQAREQLKAVATLDLDDAARRTYDYGTGPLSVDGGLVAKVDYLELRDGRGELKANLDLARATLGLRQIGYVKPADKPATAELMLVLQNGKPVSLDNVVLRSQGFDGASNVSFDAAGEVRRVDVTRLKYGHNDITMRATMAGRIISIDAEGPAFDLEPMLADFGKPPPPGADPAAVAAAEPEFRIRAQVGSLRLSKGPPLRNARGEARFVGGDVVAGTLDADASGAMSLRLGDFNRKRHVSVRGNAGAVFQVLDLTDQMRGGTLALEADRDLADPAGAYVGRIDVTGGFRLVNAPFLARLLGAAAITGIGDLLSADSGMAFDVMEAPFRFRGGRFELQTGRIYGTSVGVTWRGMMDIGRNEIDIAGTLVPAYAINRVLGAIPLVGFLITGGGGSGALAATYHASGQLDQPHITVNPLTMLLPGFLRGLFDGSFAAAGDEAAAKWDPSQDPSRQVP